MKEKVLYVIHLLGMAITLSTFPIIIASLVYWFSHNFAISMLCPVMLYVAFIHFIVRRSEDEKETRETNVK